MKTGIDILYNNYYIRVPNASNITLFQKIKPNVKYSRTSMLFYFPVKLGEYKILS